jgi:hypothetical protein
MERQLVVDIPLDRSTAEREPEETTPTWCRGRASSADVRRNSTAMASACRCHNGVSARNRARPAVVSV